MSITVVDGVAGKVCPKCNPPTWRPLDNWYKNKTTADGLQAWCKTCWKSYNASAKERQRNYFKQYYIIHRDEKIQRTAKWRLNNGERYKKNNKEYHAKHKVRANAGRSLRYRSDIEASRAKNRAWYNKNKEKVALYNLNRKAKLRGASGEITAEQLTRQYDKQRGLCFYCGTPLTAGSTQVEHKTPISRGGPHAIDNICYACASCNQHKYVQNDEEFFNTLYNETPGLFCSTAKYINTNNLWLRMIA